MPWVTSRNSPSTPGGGCFNSATAVMPWVTVGMGNHEATIEQLQFGHGGDAGGDALSRDRGPRKKPWLQFGHGGDAVGDVSRVPRGDTSGKGLQFGHGGDAVGDLRLLRDPRGPQYASIRPRR